MVPNNPLVITEEPSSRVLKVFEEVLGSVGE